MEINITTDIRTQIVMKIIFCGQKTEGGTTCKTRNAGIVGKVDAARGARL